MWIKCKNRHRCEKCKHHHFINFLGEYRCLLKVKDAEKIFHIILENTYKKEKERIFANIKKELKLTENIK